MTVGIIGYGRFGRLAASLIAPHVDVVVHDPALRRRPAGSTALTRGSLADAAGQEVVVLAVPVSTLRNVLRQMRPLVAPGALVADVCAVKVLPVQWMARMLPQDVSVLGTHPMFGPDSCDGVLEGHRILVCPVRGKAANRAIRLLRRSGLTVSVVDPDAHDRIMAETVFLTQCVGRIVAEAGLGLRDEGTIHYRRLRSIVTVARNDTPELFHDMWLYNRHARNVARRVGLGWRHIERQLHRARSPLAR